MSNLEIISETQLQEVNGAGGWFSKTMSKIMWVAMGCPPGYYDANGNAI